MFSFFRKAQPYHPTKPIAQALSTDGLPPGMDPATLDVVEQKGSYSGRHVTYFRVFDPVRLAERSVAVRGYADLDTHSELILGSGHVEQNGAVVLLSRRDRTSSTSALIRSEADRAKHGDDERVVFPDRAVPSEQAPL